MSKTDTIKYSCGHEVDRNKVGLGGAPGKCPICASGSKLPRTLQDY